MTGAKTTTYIICVVAALFSSSCNQSFFPSSTVSQLYNVVDSLPQDTEALNLIAPYRDSLLQSMNKIIGEASVDMPKGKPESLLGNFFCDALLQQSKLYFNHPAEICIMNYGGLRLPAIGAGKITVGKIYELMPFDNFLVIVKVKGDILQQLLNQIAKDGGWPLSGISMKIINGAATDVLVQNEQLQSDKTYSLLISDYMAEGGDKLEMLKNISYENSGVFVRDALIGFIINEDLSGRKIEPKISGRIQNAE
jgi:2',3'-cyclic-nucleotide 2'-phosphodiesterase (5'-nucleotidase family)